jgi:hypothetical protein
MVCGLHIGPCQVAVAVLLISLSFLLVVRDPGRSFLIVLFTFCGSGVGPRQQIEIDREGIEKELMRASSSAAAVGGRHGICHYMRRVDSDFYIPWSGLAF